ncbi:sensor histidine kinase [Knoellia sp. 3-2P3]|uniref:sensor histidine kinase n=1 Tax=unclassified Knoellia TaxID=2618719 RepID=UPI0023DA0065|nr:sensor histidine kinase [Knoellia sp. 3-2P3]MDF2092181.1 sensor histidine kinase [Knoellia sp. 3-2P3]
MSLLTGRTGQSGSHLALVYHGVDEFVGRVSGYVRAGLALDEPVLVLASREKVARVRDELGADAAAVEFADAEVGYHPQLRATYECLDYIQRQGGRRSRVVAEQALGRRSPMEVADYLRMESAANVVYQPYPVEILCPYDASALSSDLIEACHRTHAELLEHDGARRSALFVDPHRFIPDSTTVPAPPASAPAISCLTGADVPSARHFAREEMRRAGLPDDVVDDVVLAVSELVSNALTHGRPPARLAVYTEHAPGQVPVLVCHVRDDGGGPVDALAGYAPPADLGTNGRGLWMARQLCDSVEVSTDGGTTDVRVLSLLPTG